MIIRDASRDDIGPACLILNDIIEIGGTTAFQKKLNEQEFANHFLDGPHFLSCFVCIINNNELLGFQSLTTNTKLADGWADIATFSRPHNKVRGVGTELFKQTLKFARARDYKSINATIRADNSSGLAYYSKMGFIDYQLDKAVPLPDGTQIDRISKRYKLD